MAFEYAGRTGIVAIALLAALILLPPSSAAASQCSRENRVDVRDAECLSASWKNPGPFRKSTYRVRNTCPLYGQVDAKVDLVGARDRTVNLDNGRARRGWAWRHIRSVSCCSDTGICNRSDAVTDEGCVARFKQVSAAPLSCWNITASAAISGENYSCTLTARCYLNTFPRPFTNVSTITVPFFALANVHNCNGTLNAGPCDDDSPDTARVSVRDATAVELFLPSLDFRVFLSRMLWETVRIDYATLDGTATAGSDYRATSGTLTFWPGETTKTISVPVFNDAHDDDPERMTLTLSNPRPASRVRLVDATAEGVIINADPMPKAWIARFGRSVADQVLDAVDERMQAKLAPGVEARLAGQRIGAGSPFAAGLDGDVAGYADGSLTLEPRAADGTRAGVLRTDLVLWMAAVGLRGVALDGGGEGFTLAVKTDAMTVHTASDAASGSGGNLAAAEAEVMRLRLGLEGSRPFRLADGSALTPSMEIGLRRDDGDAETGFGVDIGAGLAWADPGRGLGAELRWRGLLVHESKGFRERGLSGSFAWEPVAGERGPRLSLTQTLGDPVGGDSDALLERTTFAGLAANDNGHDLQQQRLEARFGYGFPAFGDRFTATPQVAVGLSNAGRDYSLAWRLVHRRMLDDRSLELALEAQRREPVGNRHALPEQSLGFRVTALF